MSMRHVPAGLAGLIGGIALTMLGILAVLGNAGKYSAQYSHTHSAPHSPNPKRAAEATGGWFSPVYSPVATYLENMK
jgi:predicted cobalt transporter CbtA